MNENNTKSMNTTEIKKYFNDIKLCADLYKIENDNIYYRTVIRNRKNTIPTDQPVFFSIPIGKKVNFILEQKVTVDNLLEYTV